MTEELADAPEVDRMTLAGDGVLGPEDAVVGLARLVVAPDGEILGYHDLHAHADVMAKTMQVIRENGMSPEEVPDRARDHRRAAPGRYRRDRRGQGSGRGGVGQSR